MLKSFPTSRRFWRPLIVFTCALLLYVRLANAVETWPEFRGPLGNGIAVGSHPPIRWSETENVIWQVDIHGKGWSSPVVWGQQIWMTTATEDGTRMYSICVDRNTGSILHDILVFANENPRFCHATNSYASPTPIVDECCVYVHFGSYGTAAFDRTSGERLWERRDLPCDHWRGPGSSPILYDGRIYVAFDGYDQQYVVALDKRTGANLWKKDRGIDYRSDDGDHMKAYGTCQIITVDGRAQLVSPSAAETIAYNPKTGDELWRVHHGGMNAATRPVMGDGLVFLTVGDAVGKTPPVLLAVRPTANSTGVAEVAWQMDKRPPKRPSPIFFDGLLFAISDDGIATCLEAATGETIWRERIGGNFRASPVLAGGRIYVCSVDGEVTVIDAAREYQERSRNRMADGFQASPAVVADSLFLRSTKGLYRIDAPASDPSHNASRNPTP